MYLTKLKEHSREICYIEWYLLSVVIRQSEFEKPCAWQLCGFPTGSLFSITMSPELWDSSLSLFINLAYSWHGLGWDLGTLSLFWVGQKPRKTTKLPWSYRSKTWPWKFMEQTITMKSHKANLTKNRKQPKTKKNHETPQNHLEIYGNQQKTTKLR